VALERSLGRLGQQLANIQGQSCMLVHATMLVNQFILLAVKIESWPKFAWRPCIGLAVAELRYRRRRNVLLNSTTNHGRLLIHSSQISFQPGTEIYSTTIVPSFVVRHSAANTLRQRDARGPRKHFSVPALLPGCHRLSSHSASAKTTAVLSRVTTCSSALLLH
jgi:hypothetical protein